MAEECLDYMDRFLASNACSDQVKSFLMDWFPGALDVVRSSDATDRKGVDYWVEMPRGIRVGVDIKLRGFDFVKKTGKYWDDKFDDLCLETWSMIELGKVGWTRDRSKLCDYVMWLWKDSGRVFIVPQKMLCTLMEKNWELWLTKYKSEKQLSKLHNLPAYHSQWVSVPRRLVYNLILKRFKYFCGWNNV